ncbi:hypothetical protein GCM10011376_26010 [Nocardioides flavus (ex Wang et al. 2016)]|uniref:Uncharacterized protein n=1 Tax=Nocardioides flavus (ex Wang et al. 2016) TaxID=2058780 RepID=A0ABQ3HL93_9ACTN|nr:DUF6361 family protein [Nocardioides flavus (ex Wang et al. 2016)]GHE17991.1 hypothetical protein GCM10011376_26010 [Nocardioides flavus (ex Wang et al. 2016)]
MVSTFGWLDTDSEQRRKMLEVVDLFKEEGTVDELGIGSIRDALADSLFPGTSVLHTRLRYVMFIPWLMQQAAHKPSPTEMSAEFRTLEYRLIGSLMAGGEELGVIGNRARNNLKRMPSGMYWAALGSWQIRQGDFSTEGYFRRQHDYRQLSTRTVKADDPEARELLPGSGLDPHVPPAPNDWLKAVDFQLTGEEEQYLSDQIATATQGSMLAWLIRNPPRNEPNFVWDIDNLHQAPEHLRDLADHARRFSVVIHGAALMYNLLLARRRRDDSLVAGYVDRLDQWESELLIPSRALEGWSRADWWATIQRKNPRLRQPTMQFVNRWIDLLEAGDSPASSRTAADLIFTRERQIKGGRARLVNQSALDRWSGESGTGRHSFRWPIARAHLGDLYAARTAS